MDASTQFHGPVTGHYTIAAPSASHGGSNNFYFNRRDTSSAAPKPCHVIPFPRNEDIVHRPDLFAELETLLPSTTSEYHSAALWGLGGSGKTQIALEYAYRRCRNPACSVFWVHADNATTFAHDYKTIGRKLGLDSKLDGEDLLVAVRERIESEPQYLLVLDNADDLALFGVGQKPDKSDKPTSLLEYIPRSPTGMVLWTSRDERITGTLVGPLRCIGVARMTVDEARALLETARKTKTTSEELDDATALLEELQWLPLVISQAGAYMRRTSTSLNQYLSRLVEGKERWRILNETELDRHRRLDVPNSILETWHISIDRIRQENEMAYKILHIIAYLDNQNIPWEVMAAAGKFDNNKRRGQPSENAQLVDGAIIRLKEFSFVAARRTEGGERSFEMHKLVQEAVRYGLNTKSLLERKTTKSRLRLRDAITKPFRKHRVAEKGGWEDEPEVYFSNAALQVITDLFPKRMRETWAQCEMLLAHAVRVSDWAELCGKEVEASNLLRRVSDYLYECGRWRGKEQVDVKVLDLRREVLGAKHRDTIRAMGNLASTYHVQGRHNKAEEIKVKVLDLQREVLGAKHPDTIRTMGNLAATYHKQGRYNEAKEIDVKVLDLQREVLEAKHPDTIHTMGNLAAIYHEQGRYNRAEEIDVKVLDLQREVLGAKHPDTIHTMGNLAAIYHEQGRYNKAEEIDVKVLELQRKVLGGEHPDTISSMGSVANTYHKQGRYNEAEEIDVKVLELQRKVLGGEHPDTIRTMGNLAATYREQGRYNKAEEIDVKVLELQRKVLGGEYPDTISSMGSVANTYHKQGRYNEAEEISIRALELQQEVLGAKHPNTIRTMGSLASTYHMQGRYNKAEEIDVKVLELRREVLGEEHPDTLLAMYYLAQTWRHQDRGGDAIALMEQCSQLRHRILGRDHPQTQDSDECLESWKTKQAGLRRIGDSLST